MKIYFINETKDNVLFTCIFKLLLDRNATTHTSSGGNLAGLTLLHTNYDD